MAGSTVTFVVRKEDGVAQRAAEVLRSSGCYVRDLEAEQLADPAEIALVGWHPKKRNGLRFGFSSEHIRVASEQRLRRAELPSEVRKCGRIVFVRESHAKTPNAFTFAVLGILDGLGFKFSPVPVIQEGAAPKEYVLA